MGLSPRVRGILVVPFDAVLAGGSIPACTGNPRRWGARRLVRRVYPRVYGESEIVWAMPRPSGGLSPRVRGIRVYFLLDYVCARSIPACTGNPSHCLPRGDQHEVYPRVYGESPPRFAPPSPASGLSPRVRGIRDQPRKRRMERRSIPACTGNPRAGGRCRAATRVYPRVYGESLRGGPRMKELRGLSPRVRGIHRFAPGNPRSYRSIPACTGNPTS